ncbi:thioredoxin-like fold domain-containing protein MRL7 homolog, chloroplastic [Mercurialis annua]|uniref:thioredoxin-like fold domain-containing protein MRL7 homolog, chloroplastic n=1 Tax=Mercurialis annua TaxID=3986 RepID=UPI002160DB72|nr:thioredoxin-like fold domain-containing protein MRL7 homolog, chloroplastic [Mercurialis annua]XP_050206351.1 thioredoxin-like fold domain-containing protein MRL7 homolog, chloroplastic [Mercurialis annua]XP_050206352.1 thioredoxin-like fold domain-containing protein MRL7 homolog, chloroplastic [Mercurialis annua]
MNFLQTIIIPKPFPPFRSPNINQNRLIFPSSGHCGWSRISFTSFAVSRGFDSEKSDSKPKDKPKSPKTLGDRKEDEKPGTVFPTTKPRKPRRGRRSEAVAVEDFVRGSLDKTFASIRQQNPQALESNEYIMKDRDNDDIDSESDDDEEEEDDDEELEDENDIGRQKGKKKKMVVDEEGRDWPLDADVGWGIRASEYFQKHPIKNIAGEDGMEIDWEGEIDDNWVTEINCLEWESIAFHPSPLIVLAFERYNRATDNWKTLKELEKAVKVYWSAKDRLPPRSVKIDINIEKDLAYALKVKEGPQILFLRGNRIVYREREFRTEDELVQMIAHFYYNAKKPPCVNDAALSRPY